MKYNSMIAIALAALCIAPGITHAEQEGMRTRTKVGLGLGGVAAAGLGYWGLPKLRDWWYGPKYVYNRELKAAQDNYIKFGELFSDEKSVFYRLNQQCRSERKEQFDENKKNDSEYIRNLLHNASVNIDTLHKQFHAHDSYSHYIPLALIAGFLGSMLIPLTYGGDKPFSNKFHEGESFSIGFVLGLIGTYFLDRTHAVSKMARPLDMARARLLKAVDAFEKMYGKGTTINVGQGVDIYKSEMDINSDTSVAAFYSKIMKGTVEGNDVQKYWCSLHDTIYQLKFNLEDLNKCELPENA